jgi:hypothetical protein
MTRPVLFFRRPGNSRETASAASAHTKHSQFQYVSADTGSVRIASARQLIKSQFINDLREMRTLRTLRTLFFAHILVTEKRGRQLCNSDRPRPIMACSSEFNFNPDRPQKRCRAPDAVRKPRRIDRPPAPLGTSFPKPSLPKLYRRAIRTRRLLCRTRATASAGMRSI